MFKVDFNNKYFIQVNILRGRHISSILGDCV